MMAREDIQARRATITTTNSMASQYRVGDIVDLTGTGRTPRFLGLLRRPRVMQVVEVSPTTFVLEERRMTWGEWRKAIWRTVAG